MGGGEKSATRGSEVRNEGPFHPGPVRQTPRFAHQDAPRLKTLLLSVFSF